MTETSRHTEISTDSDTADSDAQNFSGAETLDRRDVASPEGFQERRADRRSGNGDDEGFVERRGSQLDPFQYLEELASNNAKQERRFSFGRFKLRGYDLAAVVFALAPFAAFVGTAELVFAALFALALSIWFTVDKLYVARFISRRVDEYRLVTNAIAKSVATVIVALYVFNLDVNRWLSAAFVVLAYVLVLVVREAVRASFLRKRKNGQIKRKVIVVGGNDESAGLTETLKTHRYLGYHTMAQVDPLEFSNVNALTRHVLAVSKEHGADSVVVAATGIDQTRSNRLVRDLVEAGIHVELSSSLADISPDRLTVRTLGKFPILYIEPSQLNGWRNMAKRLFDLAIASTVLFFAAPVFVAVALLVKFTSEGPIFFAQERVGQNGEMFKMLKFRTMVVNAEEIKAKLEAQNEGSGPLFKMKDDPRITKVGAFLRKTSLDELPQLVNVLRNDMSLIGPRPALKSEMSEWDFDLYARLRVKPGITGMWQVHGRSSASFEQYTRLDLYYVDNWSLFIDISILVRTIPAVLKSDGAY